MQLATPTWTWSSVVGTKNWFLSLIISCATFRHEIIKLALKRAYYLVINKLSASVGQSPSEDNI